MGKSQSTLTRLTPELALTQRTRFGATLETWVEVIGIEVKAAASVNSGDFKGLRKLRELVGPPFVTGIVLYDGMQALSFGEGLWAVPLRRL